MVSTSSVKTLLTSLYPSLESLTHQAGLLRQSTRLAISFVFLTALVTFAAASACAQGSTDPATASAQTVSDATKSDPAYRLEKGTNEFGVWVAGSFKSTTPIGNTAYRPTLIAALRFGRILGTTPWATFEYVADFIPLEAVFDQPASGGGARSNVYGIGVNYGGLKIDLLRRSRVKPFTGISGGVIRYSQAIPANGRKVNLTYELTSGIDVFLRPKRALTIGYKFYHMSNAFTATSNIGTNDNMITVGFSLFR
jgi:Lipid A 3-O-deacylase (PagL)